MGTRSEKIIDVLWSEVQQFASIESISKRDELSTSLCVRAMASLCVGAMASRGGISVWTFDS